jgi:hypothetical protein
MIVFYGQGGLGNQLFQYATARRLALRHNCPLVLDPHWFDHPRPGETPRPLELTRYPMAIRLASLTEQQHWTLMRGRLARYAKPFLPLRLVREQGMGVNQKALAARPGSYLFGFWQSEAYFADIREHLLKELVPIESPTKADLAVMDRMVNSSSVALHVRRGDYVTLQAAAAYHGLCSLDYYLAALQHVAERVHNPTLFVFSDDPQWARTHLSFPFPTHHVDHNRPEDAFQDLRLMSYCQHHIIANSSFSWWGAWLSKSPNGTVVAPARWYAAERPTPDLIPSRWTRISA